MTEKQEYLGRHAMAEFWGCKEYLDDREMLEKILKASAEKAGATVLKVISHKFEPQGVSVVTTAVLAESDASVHTWPEYGYAAISVFTCGNTVDPRVCIEEIRKRLLPENVMEMIVNRGIIPEGLIT